MINIILLALSGLLTGLSFLSPKLSFLVWASLIPFIHAIAKSKNRKEAALGGFIFGFFYFLTSLFWIANVTRLGLVFFLIYLAVYFLFFSILAKTLLKKPLAIISLPALWVLFELLRENILSGFGWANLGYSQYRNIYLIQLADLVGIKFFSFLIVWVNILIWQAFLDKKQIYKKLVVIIGLFAICFGYSFYRLNSLEKTAEVKVSIVQPNIAQDLKWESSKIPKILKTLTNLAKKTAQNSLVVFPEASWPLVIDSDNFYYLQEFQQEINRNNIIGGVVKTDKGFYNSALLFNKQANLVDLYYKIRLVPFGEYVPFRKFFKFIDVINSIGDTSSGDEITSFSYKDKKFRVLICFEDIFPEHVVKFARGSDFLINITNDAWFGGQPEARQHLAIMAFRAIENRISIIRSANTGISGWVSYKGEIEKMHNGKNDVLFKGVQDFTISLNKKRSFYNKYGDIFSLLCLLLLLGIFFSKTYRDKKEV